MPCYLGWSSILEWMSLTKTKCLCISAGRRQNVFAGSLRVWQKVSQGYPKRIRTRPRAKCLFQNNSKIGIDKQKSEWCATGNIACTGENYSACGYMCNYNSKISFHSKILPMKSARWKDGAQNLGNVSIKWNVCCGIPYGHRSAPVLHLLRGGISGVLAWLKLQLPMSQGSTRMPLFGIKGRQNGFPC